MLSKVDPDPRKEIEVDPDPERGLKWIRIRNAAYKLSRVNDMHVFTCIERPKRLGHFEVCGNLCPRHPI